MISFRERRAWLVGLVSIAAIAIGLGFAFSINNVPALRGVYKISAQLKDAAGLQSGNEVRVAGVKVGRVVDVRLTSEAAVIDLEIENGVEVPQETRLEVKLKTLLGQKFVDLQLPSSFVRSASNGGDPSGTTSGLLTNGDVIPLSQTKVPFEIHQAATEGSAVLEKIDKRSLRRLFAVLGDTFGASSGELRRALNSLDAAGTVLSGKSREISAVLRNAEKATRVIASSDADLEGILSRSAEVLGTLAERRSDISSLLAATNDLAENLGLLVRAVRGTVDLGVADLNSILLTAEGELDTIEVALSELGVAQEMFARPLSFGRFVEGHACAVTTADTCVPFGSPEDAVTPQHGVQPIPDPRLE